MKKLLLSSVALLGLTVGVSAADLPRRAAPPVIAPVPVFTWTGFYVGVNAGYAFRDHEDDDVYHIRRGSIVVSPDDGDADDDDGFIDTTEGTLTFFDDDDDGNGGFTGGGQVGFNYQIGAFVIGVEADLQFVDLNGDRRNGAAYEFVGTPGLTFTDPAPTVVRNGIGGLDYFGTVRGRLGVAFDRALIYATGGFAFGGGGNDDNLCGVAGINFTCDEEDDWRGGWTVGGGVEYAFTNNISVKLEGLYVNLDRDDDRSGCTTGTAVACSGVFVPRTNTLYLANGGHDNEDDFFVVRAGVNFRFGTF